MLVIVCFAALMLTGCGATLSVYDYSEDGVRYHRYDLALSNETVDNMERTAAIDADGNRYTVSGYFAQLFGDFGYTLVNASVADGTYTVSYRKAVTDGGDLAENGTAVDFTATHTQNIFVRTYTSVSENPFNGVRQNYDNVLPLRSTTVLERIKNGAVAHDENGETIVSFPALTDAFPYLKGVDPDGLLLNYVRYGSDRMESSGQKVYDQNGTAYVFSRYFDDTTTYLEYEYKRAVPYGWYLTAVAAGVIVWGVIMLVTRTKKQKPTLLDRFPYNPEEYRDYDSHLPTKL